MITVSAVVLSYNRCAEVLITAAKLRALQQQLDFNLEIIVVDNASKDDTSASINALFPEILLVTKKKNNGIAGWNAGFEVASGKYLLVLDDDSCIESGLEEAVSYLDKNPLTGILAFNIVDEQLRGDPLLDRDEAWKDGDLIVGFIGCGALIRREVYEKIGGYAEWIYLYTHEFDYGLRCMNAGYMLRFFEKAMVVHRTSALNRSKKNMRMFAVRNELAIIYKYFRSYRAKYLWRTFVNNLKFTRREGLRSTYYILLGTARFFKIRKQIGHTPVSAVVQELYAKEYWSAKPIFFNLKRRLRPAVNIQAIHAEGEEI